MKSKIKLFLKFTPFWIFLTLFKFSGGLYYTLISPFGEKLFPLWVVGLLMGGSGLIQLILDVPAGNLLDRYGYKTFLKVTTVAFLAAAFCLTFPLTRATFLLSLFFSVFGWLFFGPGINAYILSHAPKENAGKFISLRDIFCSTGSLLASTTMPLALILMTRSVGYGLFVLFFIALLALFFSPKDRQSVHKEIKLETQHHYINRQFLGTTIKMIKKLNPASMILLLHNFAGSMFYAAIWFVVPLVISHQAHSGVLSIGLGMFDFAVVVLGFLFGKLADSVNKRTLIFVGLLLFAISGMLLGFNFGWLFLLFGFLSTSGDEISGISLWTWLQKLDREHANDGAVAGVINLSEDIGWTLGPALSGILYGFVGPSWTITIGALPIFITWIIYQIMIKQHPHKAVSKLSIPNKPHRPRHKM
ncbi:MAG TPA: MFS transporter [Candidatus Udaeobacter sp.]|nr:MFS transporter [Candidatus Udaeobacter sp.]